MTGSGIQWHALAILAGQLALLAVLFAIVPSLGGGVPANGPIGVTFTLTMRTWPMRILLLGSLVALLGCEEATGPAPMTGDWGGHIAGVVPIRLTLFQNAGNEVTGFGELIGATETLPLAADGFFAAPNLTLSLSAPRFAPTTLRCVVANASAECTMNGSGFTDDPLTLYRQER